MNPSGTDTSQLSDRPEREKDTFLTAGIFFSLDRCLLMGDPNYSNRKMQKSNPAVAHSALSHKLARAAYYIMRDQVAFRPEKLFG